MLNRRELLAACTKAGLGTTLLPGALLALATQTSASQTPTSQAPNAAHGTDDTPFAAITPEMLDAAAAIAGITLSPEQRAMVLDSVREQRDSLRAIRKLHLPNSVAPALVFDPRPAGFQLKPPTHAEIRISAAPQVSALTQNEEALAFASVREQAELLRTRKVTSLELTKMYLKRLKQCDPKLHFVITLTEERALAQATAADREIAAGNYRGPLHGVPWGAKDLLNVKGYRTTWGAGGMEEQIFDTDATVVQRLDAAGAVLLAKLTLGALAMDDVWFGGKTRNPWNTKQGSSGSSAGSSSAVSAGCVGFAIGSETLGSISSPSTRCGVTGLRPTFGFVPRTGAMALSWSMDKLGPICRSVEDCALVLSTIYGSDGIDHSVRDAEFHWDAEFDWKTLRVGYLADKFKIADAKELGPQPDGKNPEAMKDWLAKKYYFDTRRYDNPYEQATLKVLDKMGVKLIPVTLPQMPWGSITPVLEAEAAAAFDELTRSGRDRLLTRQGKDDWPNIFRTARFYSAVDYIQAQRARSVAIEKMAELFRKVDVIVTSSTGTQLTATNLTGHPAVILPNGLRGDDAPQPPHTGDGDEGNEDGPGTPVSITFLGGLYDDARLLAFARAYQQKTGFHRLHPKL